MLSKVGKNIRNAHYICPTDLQTAHDKLVKKIDEQAERERRAEDMERAAKNEAKFFGGSWGQVFEVNSTNSFKNLSQY